MNRANDTQGDSKLYIYKKTKMSSNFLNTYIPVSRLGNDVITRELLKLLHKIKYVLTNKIYCLKHMIN